MGYPDGSCCPKLCHTECEPVEPVPEPKCDVNTGPARGPTEYPEFIMCPVARCQEPPRGCSFVTKFEKHPDGSCCPKLCHYECNPEPESEPEPKCDVNTGPERASHGRMCPVARCQEPPRGC